MTELTAEARKQLMAHVDAELAGGWTVAVVDLGAIKSLLSALSASEARERVLREVLRMVRDGHGCQPGYLNGLILRDVEATLSLSTPTVCEGE